jgi:hypothetical protein
MCITADTIESEANLDFRAKVSANPDDIIVWEDRLPKEICR